MKFVAKSGLVSAALLGASPAGAQAEAFTDVAAIREAVAEFSNRGPTEIGPIDSRLRLVRCQTPLALAWHGTRGDTVEVSCPEASGWRLFVPIKTAPAAVVSQAPAIARGDAITIRFAGRGFSVTSTGRAMSSGRAGEHISVRPDGSKAAIRARVEDAGLVTADMAQ